MTMRRKPSVCLLKSKLVITLYQKEFWNSASSILKSEILKKLPRSLFMKACQDNVNKFELKRGAMLFSRLSFILQIVTKNTFFLLSTFLMANGGIPLLLLGDVLTSNVVMSKASPRPFLGKWLWCTTSPSSWPWSLTFSLVFWWCTTLPSVPVLIWAASHVNLHLHIFYLLFSHLLILHLLISHLPILHLLISHLLILHLLSCSSPIHHFSTIQRLYRPVGVVVSNYNHFKINDANKGYRLWLLKRESFCPEVVHELNPMFITQQSIFCHLKQKLLSYKYTTGKKSKQPNWETCSSERTIGLSNTIQRTFSEQGGVVRLPL